VKRLSLFLVIFGLLGLTTLASPGAEAVFARASLDPTNAWVGQRVLLHVDVLGKDGWAKLAKDPTPEVAGAHVIRTESQGIRLNESVGGMSYSGQRYTFSLFPRRSGDLTVPAMSLPVVVQTYGAGGGAASHTCTTPAITLGVALPEGAPTTSDLVATPRLTVVQNWEPGATNQMPVGQALTRTVTVSAEDVAAMALPVMLDAPVAGTGMYPAQPKLTDQSDRGSLTGTRLERVTYMLQTDGTVIMPDITVTWFDLKSQALRHETVAGMRLTVIPAAATAGSGGDAEGRGWWGIVLAASILALGGVTVWRLIRHRSRRPSRSVPEPSERDRFRTFRHACHTGGPRAMLTALMAWLDGLEPPVPGAQRLDHFVARYGTTQTVDLGAELVRQATAEHDPGTWDHSIAFRRDMSRARKVYIKAQRRLRRNETVLPPLNA
jgi:hypothetical protein